MKCNLMESRNRAEAIPQLLPAEGSINGKKDLALAKGSLYVWGHARLPNKRSDLAIAVTSQQY
jgi:hypothetical protein